MMAMGIFVIGFTAVISLFPTAMVVQREIADDLVVQRITEQAAAVLRNKPVSLTALNATYGNLSNAGPCMLALPFDFNAGGHYLMHYPIAERSFPAGEIDPADRRYFWVPMVQKVRDFQNPPIGSEKPDDWLVYILIMKVEQSYGQRAVLDGQMADYDFWYNEDPDFAYPAGFIAFGNRAWSPGVLQAGLRQEQPYVPRICMILTTVRPNTDAKVLELDRGNLIPNNNWQVDTQTAAERDPTHYKIHPGDLIIDQFGTVHTVLDADHQSITLRDTVYDPASAAAVNGYTPQPMANGDPVYIWYVPAASYGTGTNYAQFTIGPAARSPLRAVVPIPGAVR